MTPSASCPTCDGAVLVVTTDFGPRNLEPWADPSGTFEVRSSGGGYRGRPIGKSTPATAGHTKYRSHVCPEVKA